jgi:hypothetical protein
MVHYPTAPAADAAWCACLVSPALASAPATTASASASACTSARGPYRRQAAAAHGSLATGRSRVGRACIAPLPDCQAAKASSRQKQVTARDDVGAGY